MEIITDMSRRAIDWQRLCELLQAAAPAEQLFAEFGFTVDNVVAKAQALLK